MKNLSIINLIIVSFIIISSVIIFLGNHAEAFNLGFLPQTENGITVPYWFMLILLSLLGVTILFIIVNILLRYKVKKLSQSDKHWRLALEGIGDGVWDLNLGTNKVFYSRQWKKILGYEENEIKNDLSEWEQRIHPEDKVRVMENFQGHLNRPTEIYFEEYRVRCKDDTYKWVMSRGKIMEYGKNGEPLRMVGTYTDITERKQAEKELRYLSFHDRLTGLYTRDYFVGELNKLDRKDNLPVSIIMADINGLKLVNDKFGYRKGNELLNQVAMIIRAACRNSDLFSRWGEDEFAIFLPNTDEETSMIVCSKIRSICKDMKDSPLQPNLALGVATKNVDWEDIQEVLREAENRMYKNKLMEGKSSRSSLITSLQQTLSEKTDETEEHTRRMKGLALRIGQALGLSDSMLDELVLVSILHDIGKIAIPDSILNKPEGLNDKEWEVMRKHSEISQRIALSTPDLAHIAYAVLSHHERWDGGGYPNQLKGHDIPLVSRIIAVIDAFDVMTHERPYKKAISSKEALEELKRCAGSQFDPSIVEVFVETVTNELELKEEKPAVIDLQSRRKVTG